jgi:hypothetical protein
MKIETITIMQRKNLGNYEHLEISASAKVEEGEEAYTAMLTLKTLIQVALEAKAEEERDTPSPISKVEEITAPAVKEKKTRVKKEKDPEITVEAVIPPVIEEPKKKEPKVVTYDSTVAEHKSIFGGYLAKKYDTSWKTVAPAEEIKAFTASLNGQPFLDDVGNILPVFLEQVHMFFGA